MVILLMIYNQYLLNLPPYDHTEELSEDRDTYNMILNSQ